MKRNIYVVCLLACSVLTACQANKTNSATGTNTAENLTASANESKTTEATGNQAATGTADENNKTFSNSETSTNQPRTVRDFFMLLPSKYFALEPPLTKAEYLKRLKVVEDTANGYLEGDGDGAQGGLTMALFKRSDASYIIGLYIWNEAQNDYYFLDYKGSVWSDISAKVIPEYSKKNMYILPRQGATIQVYAKKLTEQGPNYEVSEQGEKLYNLTWKEGKFTIQK